MASIKKMYPRQERNKQLGTGLTTRRNVRKGQHTLTGVLTGKGRFGNKPSATTRGPAAANEEISPRDRTRKEK